MACAIVSNVATTDADLGLEALPITVTTTTAMATMHHKGLTLVATMARTITPASLGVRPTAATVQGAIMVMATAGMMVTNVKAAREVRLAETAITTTAILEAHVISAALMQVARPKCPTASSALAVRKAHSLQHRDVRLVETQAVRLSTTPNKA